MYQPNKQLTTFKHKQQLIHHERKHNGILSKIIDWEKYIKQETQEEMTGISDVREEIKEEDLRNQLCLLWKNYHI